MRIFQRFEVWLLLIVGGIAILWSFQTAPNPAENSHGAEISADSPLQLRRCTLERDFGNARLDLEVRYKNSSQRPLFMQPPDVRLINAAGQDVPPFITADGHPLAARAVNLTGLKRRDFSAERQAAIRQMFKLLYRSGLPLAEAISQIGALAPDAADGVAADVQAMVDFLAGATRGIVR